MTNEQREAVDNIKIFVKSIRSDLAEESEDNQELADALDTALSLIKQKDKQIDLMAERIEWLCKSNGILLDKEHDENFTQEDVKQYFERKVEDVKD